MPWRALCLFLSLAACSGPQRAPAQLGLPPLSAVRSAHWGAVLAGPGASSAPARSLDPAQVGKLLLEVQAFERWPSELSLPSMDREAALVLEPNEEQWLQPASRLGARVFRLEPTLAERLRTDGSLGRRRELFQEVTALPDGASQVLNLVPQPGFGSPLEPTTLGVSVGRESQLLQVLLAVEGPVLDVPHEPEDFLPKDTPASVATQSSLGRELLSLRGADSALDLIMRSPFPGEAQGLWVRIQIQDGDASPEHLARVQATERSLSARSEELRERVRTLEAREQRRAEVERALRSISNSDNRRAALLFVAAGSSATLAEEFASALSDSELDRFLERLAAAGDPARLALEDSSLGWTLERAAFDHLFSHADDDGLRGVWLAMATKRAGVLSREIEDLIELVGRQRTLAELAQALVAENRIALEDSSPALRVRAYDWLAARKLAPAGFDPLASREEREAHLKALETLEGQKP